MRGDDNDDDDGDDGDGGDGDGGCSSESGLLPSLTEDVVCNSSAASLHSIISNNLWKIMIMAISTNIPRYFQLDCVCWEKKKR